MINKNHIIIVFQGTGLEMLIFCAVLASFFVAACMMSLLRRPRDNLVVPPPANLAIEHTARNEPAILPIQQQPQQQQPAQVQLLLFIFQRN